MECFTPALLDLTKKKRMLRKKIVFFKEFKMDVSMQPFESQVQHKVLDLLLLIPSRYYILANTLDSFPLPDSCPLLQCFCF